MADDIPLCVDLDGTLIYSDLLLESLLVLVKSNPLYLFAMPLWLCRGKAYFKCEVARRITLNGAALPYTQPLIQWLRTQRASGRRLWLVTASDRHLAHIVANHLDLFEGVLATDSRTNLAGGTKAIVLINRFGDKGFDYAGNHEIDLKVWPHARQAIVVNASRRVEAAAAKLANVARVIPPRKSGVRTMARALRVHQWAKNGLIFVPLLAAHRVDEWLPLWQGMLAFVAFSLCASSVYLLNDMLDLEADRQHRTKAERPFASGRLSLLFGLLMAPTLLLMALLISALLPLRFVGVLVVYYAATLAYSLGLKKIVVVDVLALAGLYTVRVVAGAAATSVALSFWLLMFSVFLFLSLAIVKRYAELLSLRQHGQLEAKGRGYQVDDLGLLQSLGTASGYLSVVVLALYLNTADIIRMYAQPKLIWGLVPIMLYWISRIWMETHRGRMHDDPLVYALKDRISLSVGGAAALLLYLAA